MVVGISIRLRRQRSIFTYPCLDPYSVYFCDVHVPTLSNVRVKMSDLFMHNSVYASLCEDHLESRNDESGPKKCCIRDEATKVTKYLVISYT